MELRNLDIEDLFNAEAHLQACYHFINEVIDAFIEHLVFQDKFHYKRNTYSGCINSAKGEDT